MHTLTIQTQFTFGDRVRFDSPTQGCSGTGTVYAITVDEARQIGRVELQDEALRSRAGRLRDHGRRDLLLHARNDDLAVAAGTVVEANKASS